MDLPRGTVTYLFTDVQGSTRLWEQAPELMTTALEMHDRIIDQAAVENGGVSVKPRGEGDSHFLVFASASDAAMQPPTFSGGSTLPIGQLSNPRWYA